jgi:hypothetical protein
MTETHVKPEKITKPIQLLGAWLAGLFSVNSCFLFAASNMPQGSFESVSLVIAAILNTPLFLLAVFLLQTRFRPELQEDSYYSTYLNQKTNEVITVKRSETQYIELSNRLNQLENKSSIVYEGENPDKSDISELLIGVNKNLDDTTVLKEELSKHGIVGFSSFGSNKHPGEKAVAISKYLPKSVATEIVKIAKVSGFTHYGYFDNAMEDIEEDILFGGYHAAQHIIA